MKVGIASVTVGVHTDLEAATGLTVFLFERPAVAAAAAFGGATGTRSFDALMPERNPLKIYAVLFTGGSAFGVDAAKGVVEFLKERGLGLRVDEVLVPVVPTAVIFDLLIGKPEAPKPEDAYRACLSACREVPEGSVGAGTGAVVGKLLTTKRGVKGGQGAFEVKLANGVSIFTLSVVNAFGDIRKDGKLLAGPRDPKTQKITSSIELMKKGVMREIPDFYYQSTTLSLVITDARLSKAECHRLAVMASAGMARAIDPVWTVFDGDLVIAASIGDKKTDVNILGAAAAEAVEKSIVRAVEKAKGLHGIPAVSEIL